MTVLHRAPPALGPQQSYAPPAPQIMPSGRIAWPWIVQYAVQRDGATSIEPAPPSIAIEADIDPATVNERPRTWRYEPVIHDAVMYEALVSCGCLADPRHAGPAAAAADAREAPLA